MPGKSEIHLLRFYVMKVLLIGVNHLRFGVYMYCVMQ